MTASLSNVYLIIEAHIQTFSETTWIRFFMPFFVCNAVQQVDHSYKQSKMVTLLFGA